MTDTRNNGGPAKWKKIRKGCADIYRHPAIENAVVDTRGFGFNPGIFWQGVQFESVADAQRAAFTARSPSSKEV